MSDQTATVQHGWCRFPSPELAGFNDTVDDITVAQANVARKAGCGETVGRAIKVSVKQEI